MYRVDDSQFQSWAKKVELKLKTGFFDALIDAGLLIKTKTTPYVPLDKGYLEESYEQIIYTLTNLYKMEFGYSVQNNPWSRGYDYSWIQHEKQFNHPKRGTWKYLEKGITSAETEIYNIIEEEFYRLID
jgi:hypothetical protein